MAWDILPKANLQYFLQKLKGKLDAMIQGHVIKNHSGTSLSQKGNLKFTGIYVDNYGDDTVANVVREMLEDDYDLLSSDEKRGFIYITDEVPDALADVAVTGEYSDLLHLPTIPNNTNQLVNGAGFITSSDSCAGAELANRASRLDGFGSGGAGNFTWGNQTGTGIWRNNDGSGGEFGFRKDNPSSGQVSMVIDGTVYVDEGRYSVIHSGNIGSQSVASASALSGFISASSRVTNAASEFTFDFYAQKLYVIVVSGNGGGGSVYLNPSIYLAACNENNTTGSLWYAAIKTGGSTITSATRAQTGTNKFKLTANSAVRWAVFPFLA